MIIDLEKLNKIHCLSQNETMGKAQILDKIYKRKIEFRANGLKKDNTVLLLNGNCLQFFIDLFTIWDMQSRCLVINENINKSVLEQITKNFVVHLVIEKSGRLSCNFRTAASKVLGSPLMLVSSGTSGDPKIVELSEKRVLDRIGNIQKMIGPQVQRGLLFLSTSFGHGLIANGLSLLNSSKELFVSHEFDIKVATELQSLVEKKSIDFFSSVPTHFEALDRITKERFLSNRKMEIHCASSFLTRSTYRKALKMFPNSNFNYHYGMTEMGSWITQKNLGGDSEEIEFNNVGLPFGLSVKINSDDGHIHIKNEVDDLITHNLPKNQTSNVVTGEYFDTKDIGTIKNGMLYLEGRRGDFINKAGNKISTLEIENTIEDVCRDWKYLVVPTSSDFYGEEIAIVFFEKFPDEKSQEEIQSICLKKLGGLKVPKFFFYLSEMPLTSNGKVSRIQVASLLEKQKKNL